MAKQVIGSILHGAYGDLYEQALCLKHYAAQHPEVELRLFTATTVRLEAFRALDLSFARSYQLWPEIEEQPEIERFFQFQVTDGELRQETLSKLTPASRAKFNMEEKLLPWEYMRDNRLIPSLGAAALGLSDEGRQQLGQVETENGIVPEIWSKPTISFLWRYRRPGHGTIGTRGQKSQEELVSSYSAMFRSLIEEFDCHILVCGMNVETTDANRERIDSKYPSFGLELPAESVTYMKGLSWPLELEISCRADVCCGHASGFSEAQWIKRGRDMVLMDAPYHYLAKGFLRRMPLFHMNRPHVMASLWLLRSAETYRKQIARMLKRAAKGW